MWLTDESEEQRYAQKLIKEAMGGDPQAKFAKSVFGLAMLCGVVLAVILIMMFGW